VNDPRPELKPQGVVAFAPVRLGRRRSRVDPASIAVGLVAIFLVAAIVHPWSGNPATPPPAAAVRATTTTSPSAPAATRTSQPAASRAPTSAAEAIDRVIDGPGGPAGSWGVAVGAGASSSEGPAFDVHTQVPIISISLDGSWSAWAGVQPVVQPVISHPKSGAPGDPVIGLKATDLCRGLPDLPSGAELLTFTRPGSGAANVEVRGWQEVGWHDEPRDIEPLVGLSEELFADNGQNEQVGPAHGGRLPDGRYEFRIVDAAATRTLTVCIGRP
jgi:hypothetical protein